MVLCSPGHTHRERGGEGGEEGRQGYQRKKKEEEKKDLHATMPTTQAAHGLGLYRRHAQQVLRVGEVGRQLLELGV